MSDSDSVTSIGNYAFRYCRNLSIVTFEGDAPTFGTGVFDGTNSTTITIIFIRVVGVAR